MQKLTQDQFQVLAEGVLNGVLAQAEIEMQRKIQAAGFVVTGELVSSLRKQTVVIGKELYAEFKLGFKGYGRFKDMRQLLFEKMPPVAKIQAYIEKVGLENFDYVPGYFKDAKRRAMIPESRAINRIAWGIAVSRRQAGVYRNFGRSRSNKKAFYNPVRGKLVYEVRDKVIESLFPVILSSLRDDFSN